MRLKDFKEISMMKPSQLIVINRLYVLDGVENYLMALTYENGKYSLWSMSLLSTENDDAECDTNSSQKTHRDLISRRCKSDLRAIESIEVCNQIIKFNGFQSTRVLTDDNQTIHELHYFLSNGIDLQNWNEVELSIMSLNRYTSSEPSEMLDLNVTEKEIKLNFREYRKSVSVFNQYSVPYNNVTPVEQSYYNPIEDIFETFYVHKFETYDFQSHLQSLNENNSENKIPKEYLDQMNYEVESYFNRLKSLDTNLVLMTYEADQALQFISKAYLDQKVISYNLSSKVSSLGFIFSPEVKTGSFGKKMFIASLQDVPNQDLELIEFELHTLYKQVDAVSICI